MALKPITLKGEQKRVLFLQVTEPIQIKGVAGSGKTTVALYRAKHLLDTQSNLFQEAKVAIFTYNKTLVKYINAITPHISGGYQADSDEIKPTKPNGINVFVTSFHRWAYHFIEQNGILLHKIVDGRRIFKTISTASQNSILEYIKAKYSTHNIANKTVDFFLEEISWMKGKAFQSKEEYFEAKRTGRGTSDRVMKADKEVIWNIYTDYNNQLKSSDLVDFDDYALLCLKIINSKTDFTKPFTHIIVDEAQDLSKAQILVISQLVSDETKSISIIADAAQRIYKSGFNWGEVGLNVRGGRTIEFKKNYRNTVQIARAALSLLDKEDDKSDFTTVETARKGEEKPIVGYFQNWEEQCAYMLKELNKLKSNDNINSTVILHRSRSGLDSIHNFLTTNGYTAQILLHSEDIDFESDSIKICTLSSIKGLEFENVFIINLNDDVIPYPAGFIEEDDEFHISTERRLLYTSMTRARERLYLLSSGKPTRYLSEIDDELLDIVGNIELRNHNKVRLWWESLDDKWKSIFQAHVDIANKDESYYRLLNSGFGDMKDGSPNIFEIYKMEFNQDFKLNISGFNPEQILNIRTLELSMLGLESISPISFLKNLEAIYCWNNRIKNITPLNEIRHLQVLDASDNEIEDISPISQLSDLELLDLSGNLIVSIDDLSNLSKLVIVSLCNCGIENIPDLSEMKSLSSIYLYGNPLRNKNELVKG